MRVTLTFDLPEEKDELMTALHAGQYCSVLIDLDTELRAKLKYSSGPDDREDARQFLQELRNNLSSELENTNWRD